MNGRKAKALRKLYPHPEQKLRTYQGVQQKTGNWTIVCAEENRRKYQQAKREGR